MAISLPSNKVFLRFVLKYGSSITRDFEEEEARSVLENWMAQETSMIGVNRSEKDVNRIWGIRADEVVFIDVVRPEPMPLGQNLPNTPQGQGYGNQVQFPGQQQVGGFR